jgi:5-methyltetrahydrofolate--homocysteine methyltransferase
MTIEHNGLIIIGENFNTSRKIKGSSPRVVHEGDKYSLTYTNLDGDKASLDITDGFPTEPAEQKNFMIPHITHALKNDDIDYITWIVKNQELNGAHIIDLCVDEITHYPEERLEWMRKAVGVMQSITDKPLSLDSSDGDTVMAGLEVYDRDISRPAINSVNLEEPRLPLIQMAKDMDTILFANAGGASGMPADGKERTENLDQLMDMMDKVDIPMDDRYLDPLVFPIGANPEFGNHYLDAVRSLREKYPEVHIFGGHSNASFGLPARKVLNNAFISLSVLAGCDSLMIDPVMNPTLGFVEFKLGVDVLTGKDDFSTDFIKYWRSKAA